MRRLLLFILFFGGLILGSLFSSRLRPREVFHAVCDLTNEHFYRDDPALRRWVDECNDRADHILKSVRPAELIAEIQDQMARMNVSHFLVYTPVEDKKLWQGQAVDTGIRAQYVEDHLVVFRVLGESAAEKQGVQNGDEILEIEGVEHVSPWSAQNRAGHFVTSRRGKVRVVELAPSNLSIDSSPRLTDLQNGNAALEISSFRSGYFDKDDWKSLVTEFKKYKHIVIDIRENAGGNFVAMLRALSTFTCGERNAGLLLRPRRSGPEKEFLDDNTDDLYQIEELDKYHAVRLQTFREYGCYQGRVTVLIGPDTSSVAEIFAQNFFYRRNSRVWGQPTAGDVVLAVWYDLPTMGRGYSVSIPEAVYLTPDQKELEGHGVYPQRELYQNLKSALAGRDAWIDAALKN
jgi:carboxyl-terminal processing protease